MARFQIPKKANVSEVEFVSLHLGKTDLRPSDSTFANVSVQYQSVLSGCFHAQ